jgi:hypothetical protein
MGGGSFEHIVYKQRNRSMFDAIEEEEKKKKEQKITFTQIEHHTMEITKEKKAQQYHQ